jgi:hypothetical protein
MRILCFGGFDGYTQWGADAAKWLKSTKIKKLLEITRTITCFDIEPSETQNPHRNPTLLYRHLDCTNVRMIRSKVPSYNKKCLTISS